MQQDSTLPTVERRTLLKAAVACHTGMASFAEAGVSDK